MANISDNFTPNSNINTVIDLVNNIYDIGNSFKMGRGCSLSLSIYRPKSSLISSSECSEDYHVYVKRKSDRMNKDELVSSIGSIKLEYVSQKGQKNQISKVTNTTSDILQQCVLSKDLALNPTTSNSMFNINLNYNIDQVLDPEKWDSEFCTILLHRAMEHFVMA